VLPGETGTSTITTAITGGFDSSVDLWATGQPKGVITTFNPKFISAPGSGTSTWTLAVPSTTPAGTYPLTLIGTGGGKNITTSFTLAVTGPDFSFTILPKTETVDRGGFGTYAITSKIVGGFDGPITFSAAAKGGAETITFGPNPIKKPGSGKSTMTVKLGSNAVLGPHTITITGTGGGKTHSETVGLKIVK
jgi:serine protease AprX